ncbi:hypothetical protein [Pseudomonas fluorescens]|uniref:hypothetical protein n=1 Tax=Pseudomonas fluorescens TaxID=294 RepID=UPI003CFE5A72
MPHVLDGRPLLVRLNARILKKHGGAADNPIPITARFLTDTDSALHQQSVEMINELAQVLKLLTDNADCVEHDSYLLQGHEFFQPEDALAAAKAAIAKVTT